MSLVRIHRRADLHRRQATTPPANTVSSTFATTSTTRPLPAAALTSSVPPHGVPPPSSSTSSSASSASSAASSIATDSASSSSSSVAPAPVAQQTTQADDVTSRTTPLASVASQTTNRATSTRTVATAASTGSDSDGMGIGSIAGIAVAAIVGIAVISAFVVWLIRRKKKNQDIDEEPFNRNSFMRNSAVIPDDDVGIPSRTRPQPNMVERQPTYGGAPSFSDAGHNSFGYNTQPSYGVPQPGYNVNPFGPGGAPATPLPHSPGYGNMYDQGSNQAGYTELTRGGPHDYPPSPHTFDQQFPNPQSPSYAGHENFPAPPASTTGYPELSPAPASSQGHVVVANGNAHDGRETTAQPGIAPVQARQPNGTAAAPGQAGKRPDTVYDPEDAYGGM